MLNVPRTLKLTKHKAHSADMFVYITPGYVYKKCFGQARHGFEIDNSHVIFRRTCQSTQLNITKLQSGRKKFLTGFSSDGQTFVLP